MPRKFPKTPRLPSDPPKGPIILTGRQQLFVKHYLTTGNGKEAAELAGYKKTNCAHMAYCLLNENPLVLKAIEEGRKSVFKKLGYGLEQMMEETADAIEFARKTENANAWVKALELRAKLHGLIDKHDARNQAAFQINIMGLGPNLPAVPQLPVYSSTPIVVQIENPEETIDETQDIEGHQLFD